MLLTDSQASDYKGAMPMLDALPKAKKMLGEGGHDADWLRVALIVKGIMPCIPSMSIRKTPNSNG